MRAAPGSGDADRGRSAEPRPGRCRGRSGCRHHPARQPVDAGDSRGGAAHGRPRQDRDFGRRHAPRLPELASTGADYVSVGALDALGASSRSELRARTGCLTRFPADLAAGLAAHARPPRRPGQPRLLLQRNRLHQRRRRHTRRARRGRRHARRGVVADRRPGTAGPAWHSPPDAGLYVSLVIRQPGRRAVPDAGRRRGRGAKASGALPDSRSRSSGRTTSSSPTARRPRGGGSSPASWPRPRRAPRALSTSCSDSAINVAAAAYPPELADRATSLEAELGRTCRAWHRAR